MAQDTNIELRNKLIYQVFNRQHNNSGTFRELEEDLDRIKSLGVDYLYLLPIHEIGQYKKRTEDEASVIIDFLQKLKYIYRIRPDLV